MSTWRRIIPVHDINFNSLNFQKDFCNMGCLWCLRAKNCNIVQKLLKNAGKILKLLVIPTYGQRIFLKIIVKADGMKSFGEKSDEKIVN